MVSDLERLSPGALAHQFDDHHTTAGNHHQQENKPYEGFHTCLPFPRPFLGGDVGMSVRCLFQMGCKQRTCKPGSVLRPPEAEGRRCDHLSGTRVTPCLMQPTRTSNETGHLVRSYVTLHRMGFTMPRPSPDARWALTPPFHPYPGTQAPRRSVFCGTFRGIAPPGRCPASCPSVPGLSSRSAGSPQVGTRDRPVLCLQLT